MQSNNTPGYKHLFFDLDRTLWDFDTNNRATFTEIYDHFCLHSRGIVNFEEFFGFYTQINATLWKKYRDHLIKKEELNFLRFHNTLLSFGIKDSELAQKMSVYYIDVSPYKTALYPSTIDTLESLLGKYQMHIVTNGFEEVQYIKLDNSGLKKYFDKVITSEQAGFKKPDRRIFEFALQVSGASRQDSLFIGDDTEADILGAHLAGIDQLWVRHYPDQPTFNKATYSVDKLKDILLIL